jgi:hypothetical protein
MISDQSCLRLADNVALQAVGDDGRAVLLELNSGQLFTCNETTRDFLAALDGERTFGQAVDVVLAQYEVERSVLHADLLAMAEELASEKLICQAPGGTGA